MKGTVIQDSILNFIEGIQTFQYLCQKIMTLF